MFNRPDLLHNPFTFSPAEELGRSILKAIVLKSRVFANGPGDRGSIQVRVIPKSQKIVLDASSFSTQDCKVWVKGEVEHSQEWSSALLSISV